jgi:hypothetical protein
LTLVSTTKIDGNTGALTWLSDTFWAGSDSIASTDAKANMGSSQVNTNDNFVNWNRPTYNGLVLYGVRVATGFNVGAGQLLFQNTSGDWETVLSNNVGCTKLLGIALDNGLSEETISVLLNGIYATDYHDQATAITFGLPLYISDTNAGFVSEVAPTGAGEYVRLIGHNIARGDDYEVVRFDPDCTWIEL